MYRRAKRLFLRPTYTHFATLRPLRGWPRLGLAKATAQWERVVFRRVEYGPVRLDGFAIFLYSACLLENFLAFYIFFNLYYFDFVFFVKLSGKYHTIIISFERNSFCMKFSTKNYHSKDE